MKKYVIGAIASPIALWLGLIIIGRKRADESGTLVFSGAGELLRVPHGLLLESAAAGVLLTYLFKG